MPLQSPDLDDRTYTDLVAEARTLIPTYAPEWTNHNPSDPGITLIELFAWLTEILIYRLNRVTDANKCAFLKLLKGDPQWQLSTQKTLVEEIRDTVLTLRRPDRAVTDVDFERLALLADPRVARARCLPRRNLESENPHAKATDKAGHISVIIVPAANGNVTNPQPSAELLQAVKNYLEPRRLLTTQVHVVGPRYVTIRVRLTLMLKRDALVDQVRTQAVAALESFLHPLTGGVESQGWPFGRDVYVSEIYALLDRLSGVDYVTKTDNRDELLLTADEDATRLKYKEYDQQKVLVAVTIKPDELVAAQIQEQDITLISPVGS